MDMPNGNIEWLRPAKKNSRAPVRLHVYDLLWINDYTSVFGLGVFHSGVEICGCEYAYGGHQYPVSGIFRISPGEYNELGDQVQYRETVLIGYTDFSHIEVQRIVKKLGKMFRGDLYHLMNNNCNHFSNYFTQILCGADIPNWVNRLAHFCSCVPFLDKYLPREWLSPFAIEPDTSDEFSREQNNTDDDDVSRTI